MKKILSAILAVALLAASTVAFVGCSKNADKTFDVVLITDGATVSDGGYNQSAWNGIESYCNDNNLTCRYYQPSLNDKGELDSVTIKNYIDLAANSGAKYIVLPGEDFAVAAVEYAPTYADINFILVGAKPQSAGGIDSYQANVMSVTFDELQAGYLAGYTSVIDGYTKLGYLGAVTDSSASYGSGYIQGAAQAADEKGIPVQLEYANYDAENLSYDYSVNVKPVYQKVEDSKKTTHKVTVEGGKGSGVYTEGENVTITADKPAEGKKFDHWDVVSNTEGVKDKKVNVSSKKDTEINLIIEKCDCTITAVWADVKTNAVTIYEADGKTPAETLYCEDNSSAWAVAPAAENGYVFDHWKSSEEDVLETPDQAGTNVKVSDHDLELTPVYVESDKPTFDVNVENGTGSGSYVSGEKIYIVADAPEEGYMFYKWESVDNQGLAAGVLMENEYNYTTSFDMVDRYASVAEKMYDDGTQVVFGGGNPQFESIFTATWNFDYQVYAYGAGVDRGSMGNCLASVVTDYGNAVKLALSDFKGGSMVVGNCSNDCIYVTGKSLNSEDKEYNEDYAAIYEKLKNDSVPLSMVDKGQDVRLLNKSKCLTINYWIKTADNSQIQND